MKDILILIGGWILGTISSWVFARKSSGDIADAKDQINTHTQDQLRELAVQISALGKLTQYSLAQIKEAGLGTAAELEKWTLEEFGRTKRFSMPYQKMPSMVSIYLCLIRRGRAVFAGSQASLQVSVRIKGELWFGIFSAQNTGVFQAATWPTCWTEGLTGCSAGHQLRCTPLVPISIALGNFWKMDKT
ncbi:hypothetical protein [Stutzerimonas kunmingensis]|uniref:Uncharacterized protein n=1 Tax=Stutzerimonas kunmingensis TaxID=1211807 RepID=A0A9X1N6W6_9GAMM|nr:hypothetical protein [Stutzerimonas kunmingensis]MCD1610083.1 hypothetical protein [Stutzerimonas kunmingensis]